MAYLNDLYRQFLRFPRAIKLFYISDMFFGFAMAINSTLFNLHLLQVGFTADHIGRLQSVAALLMAACAIPVGLAGDRWGRRGMYVTGSILFSVPMMAMPFLTSFPALLAANCIATLASTLMMVNESPLLAGEVGPDQRASVFSFMMINFFVWNTLGIQIAGFLSNWLPAGHLTTYQWPLVVGAICGVVSGVIRGFLPFNRTRPERRGFNLRPSKVTVMLGLLSLLSGAFTALTQNFNNVILAKRFGFGAEYIATVLTIAGVVGWIGSLFVPWTSRKLGDLRAYASVIGLQGLVLLYLGVAATPGSFLPGFWVRAVLGTMQMSLFSAFAMDITAESERSTANSYATVGRNLGSAGAAKVYGAALAASSFTLPFSVAGIFAVGTALFAVLAFRKSRLVGQSAQGA